MLKREKSQIKKEKEKRKWLMMEKGLNGEQGHWGILGCVAKHVKPKEEVIVIKIERFTEKREIKTI